MTGGGHRRSISFTLRVPETRVPAPAHLPPAAPRTAVPAGRPLDGATRAVMEPRFGHDFSRVRVHHDPAAARAVGASAFTVGHDVTFAGPAPSVATPGGRELMAHELTHVVQQERGGAPPGLDSSAPHEREAAAAATGPGPVHVRHGTAVGLARQPAQGSGSGDLGARLMSEAITVLGLHDERQIRVMQAWVDAYMCSASYAAFRKTMREKHLVWGVGTIQPAGLKRMSPELRKMLFGPSEEDPEYWEQESLTLGGQRIYTKEKVDDEERTVTKTRSMVDFVTVTIPGVGDQGDRYRDVPVYSWRMTPGALRAYLTHASGGPLTPFEEKLVLVWDEKRVQVEPRMTEEGLIWGYYVGYDDTWYDSTGTIAQYTGRQDYFLVPEDPIGEILVGGAIGKAVTPFASGTVRTVAGAARKVLSPAWKVVAGKLRPLAIKGRLLTGAMAEGLGGSSNAFSGMASQTVTLVERQGVKATATAGTAAARVEAQAATAGARTTATTLAPTTASPTVAASAATTGSRLATVSTQTAVRAAAVTARPTHRVVPEAQQVDPRQGRMMAHAALVAQYMRLATRKLPQIVRDVLARERATPNRARLAALRMQFQQLMQEVGDARALTPVQRARAELILTEARELARADFGGLQSKIWDRLRADPELEAIANQLIEAGGAADIQQGALRLWTQRARGTISYEPMNIEHSVRLSDNPWAAKEPENLMVTDAAQNQQYNEALRQHGHVWPTDPIEDFIVRHRLNRQGIDFQPGQAPLQGGDE